MNTTDDQPTELECTCLELQDVCEAVEQRGGRVARVETINLSGYRLGIEWPQQKADRCGGQ